MEPRSIEELRRSPRVSDEDRNLWAFASNMLIEQGRVQPITDYNVLRYRITDLGTKIVALSLHGLRAYNSEEEMAIKTIEQSEKLDNELFEIAFGSNVHPHALDPLLEVAVQTAADELAEELKAVRKAQGRDDE